MVTFVVTSIYATHISTCWFKFVHSCFGKLLITTWCFINICSWIWPDFLIGKDIRLKNELLLTILMVQILLTRILTTKTSILLLFRLTKALTFINFILFACVLIITHFRLIFHWSDILITLLLSLLILLFVNGWCHVWIAQKLLFKVLSAHVVWSHTSLFFRYLSFVGSLD